MDKDGDINNGLRGLLWICFAVISSAQRFHGKINLQKIHITNPQNLSCLASYHPSNKV